MRIIITGGAGFIGSNVAKALLNRGDDILIIDNFCDFYDPKIKRRNIESIAALALPFELAEIDLRDADAIHDAVCNFKPDGVVHLAAMAGVRPSIENPKLYYDVNLMGTLNLLKAMQDCACKRMAFASSSSVYGNSKTAPFTEALNVDRPISPYAATKKAGELMMHTEHALNGLSVCCLRFFTVYGPGQRPDLAINKFAHLIKEGKTVPMFGDGSTARDYTFIDDIVAGVVTALDYTQGAPKYEIFNLGGGHMVTLLDMIHIIADAIGKPAKIEQLPMQPGDVQRTDADISHAHTLLGYQPKTAFKDGIRAFVSWMEAQS